MNHLDWDEDLVTLVNKASACCNILFDTTAEDLEATYLDGYNKYLSLEEFVAEYKSMLFAICCIYSFQHKLGSLDKRDMGKAISLGKFGDDDVSLIITPAGASGGVGLLDDRLTVYGDEDVRSKVWCRCELSYSLVEIDSQGNRSGTTAAFYITISEPATIKNYKDNTFESDYMKTVLLLEAGIPGAGSTVRRHILLKDLTKNTIIDFFRELKSKM